MTHMNNCNCYCVVMQLEHKQLVFTLKFHHHELPEQASNRTGTDHRALFGPLWQIVVPNKRKKFFLRLVLIQTNPEASEQWNSLGWECGGSHAGRRGFLRTRLSHHQNTVNLPAPPSTLRGINKITRCDLSGIRNQLSTSRVVSLLGSICDLSARNAPWETRHVSAPSAQAEQSKICISSMFYLLVESWQNQISLQSVRNHTSTWSRASEKHNMLDISANRLIRESVCESVSPRPTYWISKLKASLTFPRSGPLFLPMQSVWWMQTCIWKGFPEEYAAIKYKIKKTNKQTVRVKFLSGFRSSVKPNLALKLVGVLIWPPSLQPQTAWCTLSQTGSGRWKQRCRRARWSVRLYLEHHKDRDVDGECQWGSRDK